MPGPATTGGTGDGRAGVVLTAVMPAHNEDQYLTASVNRVVEGLTSRGEPFEVLIVENGSTDGTVRVANQLVAEHDPVRLLCLDSPDYGAALRSGLRAANGEWAVVFDVDYVDVGFLERAHELALAKKAAIVVGSKRSPGSEDERSLGRKAVTAGFTGLLRVAFGLRVSDTHGLKLLHLPVLADLIESSQFGREIFDTELILRAERAGLTVTELPVRVTDQRPARSSITRRIPRTVVGLVRLRFALRRDTGA